MSSISQYAPFAWTFVDAEACACLCYTRSGGLVEPRIQFGVVGWCLRFVC